ncbi:hypothetical protein UFOVP558_62 [uncultured Caudovirales phage]|uniref:Uncharacterized protein n=1 Tax=uncultured Caudovirales phage TaxID=2100421 RepID=A0A6J5MYH8_9CAUD|nr:hypothetical protein UFOVP558_62 [uncultured Caudovirales phage]
MSQLKGLPMWVIYDDPADHPGKTVARLWVNKTPTDQLVEASLEQLRKRFISMGYISIGRFKEDDPKIVEVWI